MCLSLQWGLFVREQSLGPGYGKDIKVTAGVGVSLVMKKSHEIWSDGHRGKAAQGGQSIR
jgi:hypothetical protein